MLSKRSVHVEEGDLMGDPQRSPPSQPLSREASRRVWPGKKKKLLLSPAKNTFCIARSMVAAYPLWVWGEGKEDQILAALETDLGGSWEGIAAPPLGHCSVAF